MNIKNTAVRDGMKKVHNEWEANNLYVSADREYTNKH